MFFFFCFFFGFFFFKSGWCSWLSRAPHTREVPSSILGSDTFFFVVFRRFFELFPPQNRARCLFHTPTVVGRCAGSPPTAIPRQEPPTDRSIFWPLTHEGERLSENNRRPFLNVLSRSSKCLIGAWAESRWLSRSSKKRSKKMRSWGNLKPVFRLLKKKGRERARARSRPF